MNFFILMLQIIRKMLLIICNSVVIIFKYKKYVENIDSNFLLSRIKK